MKPRIGVTTSFNEISEEAVLKESYILAVTGSGGFPVPLAPIGDLKILLELSRSLDGIILTGGPDVDPSHYGEAPHENLGEVCPRRDAAELMLVREMYNVKKPILGICRGLQVINVALGGTLYQDIPSCVGASGHSQDTPADMGSHEVQILGDTILHKLFGETHVMTNSFHHQCVKDIAPGFKMAAAAPDGVLEAMESADPGRYCVAVQWHPERMIKTDRRHLKIFADFIAQTDAKKYNILSEA